MNPARQRPKPGPVALSGGRDHPRASTTADRALLACLPTATPHVAVIPVAPAGRTRSAAELRALQHWTRLGATVDLVALGPGDRHGAAPAALREADLIVLAGGRRTHPVSTAATTLWPQVIERWREGAALLGSSVGATVLCGWRQQVAQGSPLRFVRGAGGVADAAAAPHFNRPIVRRWTLAASRAQPYLTIVGLDERTAIVGRDGCYTVHGRGAVTIIRAGASRRYDAGAHLRLGVEPPSTTQSPGRRSRSTAGFAEPGTAKFPHPWEPVGGDPATARHARSVTAGLTPPRPAGSPGGGAAPGSGARAL